MNREKILKDISRKILEDVEEIEMKTYLTIWFNSEGAPPTEVVERILSLGFKPIKGHYDHVYDWGREPALEEVLQLANNLHETLRGLKVIYKLETI